MSEARERYYDYQRLCPNSGFIYAEEITNYVSELESEKAELIELLSDIAHFTKIESKKAQCYPAWWHRIEDLLKKHGVEI